MNDTSEVVTIRLLRQKELHDSLVSALSGDPIDIDIPFDDWGRIETPYVAYYGRVPGREILVWWKKHGPLLFAKNLRSVLGDTEVNEEIRDSLENQASNFWYFNNGITLTSSKVERIPAGGMERSHGLFRCSDLSVVNGAQTVATIGKYGEGCPGIDLVSVQVRVVSLESADPKFGESVTKTNNRQNRIDNRDFASLDLEQLRLRNELAIDGIQYHLHRSDTITKSDISLDMVESTTARACAVGDPGLAVQLKREIGKLWENLDTAPYRTLFNPTVSGQQLWRAVKIQRSIDSQLDLITTRLAAAGGRPYSVSIHGNRLVAALVFNQIPGEIFSKSDADFSAYTSGKSLQESVERGFESIRAAVEHNFPGSVIPTLFKNASKCKKIFEEAKNSMNPPVDTSIIVERVQQQLI